MLIIILFCTHLKHILQAFLQSVVSTHFVSLTKSSACAKFLGWKKEKLFKNFNTLQNMLTELEHIHGVV